MRNAGNIKALALGDFSVSMGQGLVHWQGMAFKKSGEVMAIKRQAAVLKPYNSAGEFYFHRGIGLTFVKKRIETTVFVSMRRLDANTRDDSISDGRFFTSFITSGYHRNASEIDSRNKLGQVCAGSSIQYRGKKLNIGVNGVYYRFAFPLQKRDEPYNLYAINGSTWFNASIDYSYTWKNIHFFGESAISQRMDKAFVNGMLLSV